MGTRADFYIEEKKKLVWLGSVAWDGYEWAEDQNSSIMRATTARDFKGIIDEELAKRDDFTHPDQGWPWPWEDSCTTDYAYVFRNKKVEVFVFGKPYSGDPKDPMPELASKVSFFPNMKAIQKVDFGARSGLIVMGIPKGKQQ